MVRVAGNNRFNEVESPIISEEQTFLFPSQVVEIDVQSGGVRQTLKIPRNELFRAKSILQDNEYSILNFRSHRGPMTVVDVGANVGLYAIYMKAIDPGCVIHCFEPSPSTFVLLHANLGDITGIYLHSCGLFDRSQQATMHIHRMNTGQNSIKSSGEYYGDSVQVPLKDAGAEFDRLSLIDIDVLKIDTEGCEVEILGSLGHRLDRIDYVLVEYHSEKDRRQIDGLLKEFHVFGSKSSSLGDGVVKYISSRLIV